ncbi:maleylpyruvate isomerase family mycothiol-dependent enzyme [Kitasatospora sp. NBC_01287]|uniref:maleylpyruvate isomerase family mycothiol-dependent enzyme n=1 Tax=Kitasatospora sp. NBC_01287 TaxID=2903573 RepID=UPI00224E0E1E|nr:maleylpyruvate isomerase family mycothiol-dependent enzyme [Kitasatospora sp. NBC_01287]MCX4746272.1 maleylpyruvate isomerase family mycothiol-dependent enzyme [Kitasatospora sp. NBC_01287]
MTTQPTSQPTTQPTTQPTSQPDPHADLARVAESTERLLHTAAGLDQAAIGAPSALPTWSRGHVLAHLARNADSLVNLLESARTGLDIPQYASDEAREQGIAQGAGRPPAEQLTDLRESAARLAEAAAALSEAAWGAELKHRHGYTFPATDLPWKRLQELEYHHVDLAAGYTPAHWPEEFAAAEFATLTARFATLDGLPALDLLADDTGAKARLGGEGEPVLRVEGPVRALTAWLSGRSDGDGLQVHRDGGPLADPRAALPALPAMR